MVDEIVHCFDAGWHYLYFYHNLWYEVITISHNCRNHISISNKSNCFITLLQTQLYYVSFRQGMATSILVLGGCEAAKEENSLRLCQLVTQTGSSVVHDQLVWPRRGAALSQPITLHNKRCSSAFLYETIIWSVSASIISSMYEPYVFVNLSQNLL